MEIHELERYGKPKERPWNGNGKSWKNHGNPLKNHGMKWNEMDRNAVACHGKLMAIRWQTMENPRKCWVLGLVFGLEKGAAVGMGRFWARERGS